MTPSSRMSLAEYLDTPETLLPQELVDGVLRVADAPLLPHQLAVRDFLIALSAHVDERHLGEVIPSPIDVILDAARPLVVQPDLLFVSNQRRAILSDKIYGAPDLVVEVLSPHPRIGRLHDRVAWYAQYGVRECWLYHHDERRLAVLTLKEGGVVARGLFDRTDAIESAVLPEFTLSVDAVRRFRF